MSGGRRTIGEIPASEIPSLCRPLAAAVCRLVVIVVVGVRLAAAGDVSIDASRQGQFPIAVVTVVVEDRAHVPAWILDHAEKEASRIYRRAGVTTVWRETAAAVNGFTVELIIMPALTAPRMGRARFVLGATTETRECGGSSYVFYDQVTGLFDRRTNRASGGFGIRSRARDRASCAAASRALCGRTDARTVESPRLATGVSWLAAVFFARCRNHTRSDLLMLTFTRLQCSVPDANRLLAEVSLLIGPLRLEEPLKVREQVTSPRAQIPISRRPRVSVLECRERDRVLEGHGHR
jgi:hypothetical protein